MASTACCTVTAWSGSPCARGTAGPGDWKDLPWVPSLSRPHFWPSVSPSAKWGGGKKVLRLSRKGTVPPVPRPGERTPRLLPAHTTDSFFPCCFANRAALQAFLHYLQVPSKPSECSAGPLALPASRPPANRAHGLRAGPAASGLVQTLGQSWFCLEGNPWFLGLQAAIICHPLHP